MRDKRRFVVSGVVVLALLVVFASVALAGDFHFNSITFSLGNSLHVNGILVGLGNEVAEVNLTATGKVTAMCQNPGGLHAPPGRRRPLPRPVRARTRGRSDVRSPQGTVVFVGLGANLGDAAARIRAAVGELARGLEEVQVSSLYRSLPEDGSDQPDYLNAVVRGRTRRTAEEMLAWALSLATAYEVAEQAVERQDWGRELFNASGPEIPGNAVADLAVFAVGHGLGKAWNRRT